MTAESFSMWYMCCKIDTSTNENNSVTQFIVNNTFPKIFCCFKTQSFIINTVSLHVF